MTERERQLLEDLEGRVQFINIVEEHARRTLAGVAWLRQLVDEALTLRREIELLRAAEAGPAPVRELATLLALPAHLLLCGPSEN